MFGALVFEKDPLTLNSASLLDTFLVWLQTAGGFAAAGLAMWLLMYFATRRGAESSGTIFGVLVVGGVLSLFLLFLGPIGWLVLGYRALRGGSPLFPTTEMNVAAAGRRSAFVTSLFAGATAWSFLSYLVCAALYIPEVFEWLGSEGQPFLEATGARRYAQVVFFTVAGGSALFAVLVPILADLGRFSPRRILAIAQLSFKEAVRRKVLWVFLALLLVVLFGSWFIPYKHEDQVRNYVQVVSLAQAILLILAALLIASFGIPEDIKSQTIHTVLTKPVERFELYLGRFLGYITLMTLVLLGITVVGLGYVLRGVSEEAKAESLKAREPVYGQLVFEGTKDRDKAENVGREWEYRSYIFGPMPNQPTQYAVWEFATVPTALTARDRTRCEFTFDIYRTTKGVEGQGVFCTFYVESWRFDANNPAMKAKYDEARRTSRGDADAENKLAEEFGYYEVASKEIQDYHTQSIDIPSGVFKNALGNDDERRTELSRRRESPPPLRIRVKCESRTQFVGMAKYDLYLREDDPSGKNDTARFCVNFFKASVGVWLRLCLLIGLAVALSTYLSGVITLLTTAILYVFGFFQEFIEDIALRRNVGGGPVEAMIKLVKRPGGESMAVPLEDSTASRVSSGFDEVFAWVLRRVMDVIPDVTRYSFTDFVAEGVAVDGGTLFMSTLLLAGYLMPWAILAYYLLRWREIAGAT